MIKPISLGNTVRDIATGMQGFATSKVEFMTGNVQFIVQPPVKDGAFVDGLGFDAQQLDYVDDGIASRVTPAPKETGIVLGSKVKDIVTGYAGIATRKTTFLNGCVYFTVIAPIDKDGSIKEDFVEFKRLETVGEGVIDKIAKKLAKDAPAALKSGGPVTRLMKRG